jgi:hypothetical protein
VRNLTDTLVNSFIAVALIVLLENAKTSYGRPNRCAGSRRANAPDRIAKRSGAPLFYWVSSMSTDRPSCVRYVRRAERPDRQGSGLFVTAAAASALMSLSLGQNVESDRSRLCHSPALARDSNRPVSERGRLTHIDPHGRSSGPGYRGWVEACPPVRRSRRCRKTEARSQLLPVSALIRLDPFGLPQPVAKS